MPPTRRPLLTAARFAEAFGDAVVRLDDVLAVGITPEQLRAAVARGLVVRVVRGRYALHSAAGALDPWAEREAAVQQHLALLRAVLATQPKDTWASHASAAFALGQATPGWVAPARVSLIRPGAANDVGPGYVLRGSGLHADDVTEVEGIPVTSIERTAVDLARGRSAENALVALDAAARARIARLTGADGNALRYAVLEPGLRAEAAQLLEGAYARCFGWPGTVVVRDLLPLVEPASESPLESRSRCWFWSAGLRHLRIGSPVAVSSTSYFADFLDDRRKVIGEADGWGKYGTDLQAQRDAWDRERSRQGELESHGYRVVRWTSSDARTQVIQRMHHALTVA